MRFATLATRYELAGTRRGFYGQDRQRRTGSDGPAAAGSLCGIGRRPRFWLQTNTATKSHACYDAFPDPLRIFEGTTAALPSAPGTAPLIAVAAPSGVGLNK